MVAAMFPGAACGKKGPPLPPLSNRPRAPEAVSARRQGDRVLIRFTVPRANQSGVQPANLERVDVYALTGPRLPAARLIEHGTVVASVPVRYPPPPEGEEEPSRPAPPSPPGAVEQGALAVVEEAVTPSAFQVTSVEEDRDRDRPGPRPGATVVVRRTPLAPPDVGRAVPPTPVRRYVVVGVNRSGRRGSPSPVVSVALSEPPAAPERPVAEVRERSVELTWAAPAGTGGTRAAPADDSSPPPLPSRALGGLVSSTTGFNVYLVPSRADDEGDPAVSPYDAVAGPQPLTPRPIPEPRFSDTQVRFGQERCYAVTSARMAGSATIESAFSSAACVKVADVFPPAAPRSLSAVATEKSVNLSWDANGEADLAGYLVLRSDRPDGPLEPLRTELITETTWNDTTVTPGARYRYAVVAVDKATPPNRSGPSNEVEAGVR